MMSSDGVIFGLINRTVRTLASLKIAIPLLVVTIVATIAGSLFPQPDLFRTWWYLGLLGLLGFSLLLITILHIPAIRRKKGRKALIGVVTTHAGILVMIIGAIYGGIGAERFQLKAIEGEMTVVPGMPFVMELAALEVEEYPPETFAHMDLELVPKKRQESRLVIHRNGQPVAELTAAPGRPTQFAGYKILPSLVEIGWYFEVIVTDARGREKTFPIEPWNTPLFTVSGRQYMAHRQAGESRQAVQVFTLVEGQPEVLGTVSNGQELEIDGNTLRLGSFKRYTGMAVYNRPHMPLLVTGVLLMLAGLVWHFYHRYRD